MVAAVAITRVDLDASGLRRAVARERNAAASRRMLALALVLEGQSWTEAARAAGMDRQTLRDWLHRYNAEGPAGLRDRTGETGPKRRLSPAQEAEVAEWVRRGPDPAIHGVVRWRRADLARIIAEQFGVVLAERSVGDVLRRLGFRRLAVRPRHPGQGVGRARLAPCRAGGPPLRLGLPTCSARSARPAALAQVSCCPPPTPRR
jgi:transposase